MARMVQVRLAHDVALHLQQGIADLNCWIRGFGTAMRLSDRVELEPIGISESRDINIILKGALGDFDAGGLSPEEMESERLREWIERIMESESPGSLVHRAAALALDGEAPPPGRGLPVSLEIPF